MKNKSVSTNNVKRYLEIKGMISMKDDKRFNNNATFMSVISVEIIKEGVKY